MLPSYRTEVLAVGVTIAAPGEPAPQTMTEQWYECRFETRDAGGGIELLAPCDGWNHYEFPNGRTALSHEDLSKVLDIEVNAGPETSTPGG
jgi:hypothetical protein